LHFIVAVLTKLTYIINILTLRNWKCNNIILLLLSFLPNFPNTHHVLYFLSSCSFQMVLFYIFGCPLSRSFRLTLPLSYYRNRRAKAKIEEKYSEMPYGIEFFFQFPTWACEICSASEFSPDSMTTRIQILTCESIVSV